MNNYICANAPHISAKRFSITPTSRRQSYDFRPGSFFSFSAVNQGPGVATVRVIARESFLFTINLLPGESTGHFPIFVNSRFGVTITLSSQGATNATVTIHD